MRDHDRRSGTAYFERFVHAVTAKPENLQQIPALARALGIGESTAYKYRQRFAHMAQHPRQTQLNAPLNGPTAREETVDGGADAAQHRTGLAQREEDVSQLTPEELDQEIAKILQLAGRIRGGSVVRTSLHTAYRTTRNIVIVSMIVALTLVVGGAARADFIVNLKPGVTRTISCGPAGAGGTISGARINADSYKLHCSGPSSMQTNYDGYILGRGEQAHVLTHIDYVDSHNLWCTKINTRQYKCLVKSQ